MAKAKDKPLTYEDLEKALYKVVKMVMKEFEKMLIQRLDSRFDTKEIIARLDLMNKSFIEIKEEVRNIRRLHEFWAERHLSPELMEEFLTEQEGKRRKVLKRLD